MKNLLVVILFILSAFSYAAPVRLPFDIEQFDDLNGIYAGGVKNESAAWTSSSKYDSQYSVESSLVPLDQVTRAIASSSHEKMKIETAESACCPKGQSVCDVKAVNLNCDLSNTTVQDIEPELAGVLSLISLQETDAKTFVFEKGNKEFCDKCYKKAYSVNGNTTEDFKAHKDKMQKELNSKIRANRATKIIANMNSISDVSGAFTSVYMPYINRITNSDPEATRKLVSKFSCASGEIIQEKVNKHQGCSDSDGKKVYAKRVEEALAKLDKNIKFGNGDNDIPKELLDSSRINDLVTTLGIKKHSVTNTCKATRDDHNIFNYAAFVRNADLSGTVYGSLDVLLKNEKFVRSLSEEGFCKSDSNISPRQVILGAISQNEYGVFSDLSSSKSTTKDMFLNDSYDHFKKNVKSDNPKEMVKNLDRHFSIAMIQDPDVGLLLSDKTSFCNEVVYGRMLYYNTPESRNREKSFAGGSTVGARVLFKMGIGSDDEKLKTIQNRIDSIAKNHCDKLYDDLVGNICASDSENPNATMKEIEEASNDLIAKTSNTAETKNANITLGSIACSLNISSPERDFVKERKAPVDLRHLSLLKKDLSSDESKVSDYQKAIDYNYYVKDGRFSCKNLKQAYDVVYSSTGAKNTDNVKNLRTNTAYNNDDVDNEKVASSDSDVEVISYSHKEAAVAASSNKERGDSEAFNVNKSGKGSLESPIKGPSKGEVLVAGNPSSGSEGGSSSALNIADIRGTIDQTGLTSGDVTANFNNIAPLPESGVNTSDIQAVIQESEEAGEKFVKATEQLKEAGVEDNEKLMNYLSGKDDELGGLLGENDQLKKELEELKKLVAQKAMDKKAEEQSKVAETTDAKDQEIKRLKTYIANIQRPVANRAPASTQNAPQQVTQQAAPVSATRGTTGAVTNGKISSLDKFQSSKTLRSSGKAKAMTNQVTSKLLSLVSEGNYESFSFQFKDEALQLVSEGEAYNVTLDDIVLSDGVVTKIRLSGKEIDVSQLQEGSQSALNSFIQANTKVAEKQLAVVEKEKEVLTAKNDIISEELKRYRDLLAGLAE